MIWFTGDRHFRHLNRRGTGIIDYCNRPFRDILHMEEELIRRHNEIVKPEDIVYDLGDFGFGRPADLAPLLKRLNGVHVLIRGNHDGSRSACLRIGFADAIMEQELFLMLDGSVLRLRHVPPAESVPPEPGVIRLCGHVHEKWKVRNNVVNVGVDVWDFRPVSLQEIVECLER